MSNSGEYVVVFCASDFALLCLENYVLLSLLSPLSFSIVSSYANAPVRRWLETYNRLGDCWKKRQTEEKERLQLIGLVFLPWLIGVTITLCPKLFSKVPQKKEEKKGQKTQHYTYSPTLDRNSFTVSEQLIKLTKWKTVLIVQFSQYIKSSLFLFLQYWFYWFWPLSFYTFFGPVLRVRLTGPTDLCWTADKSDVLSTVCCPCHPSEMRRTWEWCWESKTIK